VIVREVPNDDTHHDRVLAKTVIEEFEVEAGGPLRSG
jgi:hypothetical protein|tara:strand:+ start:1199 stop:1309 length:111 start_codon:yes stop_codon:yes gene_type:complete